MMTSKYRQDGLQGGHLIMLGPNCEEATMRALQAYPRGLQVGGNYHHHHHHHHHHDISL